MENTIGRQQWWYAGQYKCLIRFATKNKWLQILICIKEHVGIWVSHSGQQGGSKNISYLAFGFIYLLFNYDFTPYKQVLQKTSWMSSVWGYWNHLFFYTPMYPPLYSLYALQERSLTDIKKKKRKKIPRICDLMCATAHPAFPSLWLGAFWEHGIACERTSPAQATQHVGPVQFGH